MDNETGELLISSQDKNIEFWDIETGEKVTDMESEEELDVDDHLNQQQRSIMRKSKFAVPRSYLTQSDSKNDNACYLSSQQYFSLTDKKKVFELKEEIIMGYNKFSHRLFLIPTFFLFPKIGAVYIVLVELLLHIWSHKKNHRNKNPKIYYRSPLHNLTSHFCNYCRETKDLQELRKYNRFQKDKFVATSF